MTEQELIARLREGATWDDDIAAADRIEELVKERDEARIAINQIGEAMGVLGIVQCLDDIVAEAKKRFAKLTKAVEALREISSEASVPVHTWRNGINFKKMYTSWRALAVKRIDRARAVLAELEGK